MKCLKCGGEAKKSENGPDKWICIPCGIQFSGTGTKPEPEIISKSVQKRLAIQRPEPEQDERINSTYAIKFQQYWGDKGEKWNGKPDIKQFAFEIWRTAINSRNAEIDFIEEVGFNKGYKKAQIDSQIAIESLKAEIQSLLCCGNCRTYRPWDSKCTNGNGLMRSDYSCDNWRPKIK